MAICKNVFSNNRIVLFSLLIVHFGGTVQKQCFLKITK